MAAISDEELPAEQRAQSRLPTSLHRTQRRALQLESMALSQRELVRHDRAWLRHVLELQFVVRCCADVETHVDVLAEYEAGQLPAAGSVSVYTQGSGSVNLRAERCAHSGSSRKRR